MSETNSWESFNGSRVEEFSNERVNFLKINEGEPVKIRPLGMPYEFKKYMVKDEDGKFRSAICLDEESCPVANKHNIRPKKRWAINCINLKTKKIEILENSSSLFKCFKTFWEETGKNPGGTEGGIWVISSSGSGLNKRYATKFVGPNTLSDEDIKLINDQTLYKLNKIYKATDPNKIEQVLFGKINSFDDRRSVKKEVVVEIPDKNLGLATLEDLFGSK